MDWKQKTTDTYNNSAREMAEYFKGIGSRTKDIKKAFELIGDLDNPKVLEIGCGDGRDAKEIIKLTDNYLGFDISKELIKLAKANVPNTRFEVGDVTNYKFPDNLDIVFAFASLLHINRKDMKEVFDKLYWAIKPGGVFFISLKYRQEYAEEIKKDGFGERMFYFYNPELIQEIAGENWDVVYSDGGFVTGRDTKWFEVGLQKITSNATKL